MAGTWLVLCTYATYKVHMRPRTLFRVSGRRIAVGHRHRSPPPVTAVAAPKPLRPIAVPPPHRHRSKHACPKLPHPFLFPLFSSPEGLRGHVPLLSRDDEPHLTCSRCLIHRKSRPLGTMVRLPNLYRFMVSLKLASAPRVVGMPTQYSASLSLDCFILAGNHSRPTCHPVCLQA